MPEEIKQSDNLAIEASNVMRALIAAIRAVKLYPPNNPVYFQSVKEVHEVLSRFLESQTEYYIGVQKTFFTYSHIPIGKDTDLNKTIAQDMFAKGIRDITFLGSVTEKEILDLLQALALSTKDMAMKSGISAILWEKGVSSIKITESGLDEIITADTMGNQEEREHRTTPAGEDASASKSKVTSFTGHTLVLDGLTSDPEGFCAAMVELAKETQGEYETVEDRLFVLYREAGRKIMEEHPDQIDTLFAGLAQSVISLEHPYREALIAGKLYADMDSENVKKQKNEIEEQVPGKLNEILTGRFWDSWTVQHVADLLKEAAAREFTPPAPPSSASDLPVAPLSSDLENIVREMAEYTTEEMEELKSMSGLGMEPDVIEAAVRTLIFLIPLVKDQHHDVPDDKEIALFSGVIHQLEETLSYLLEKKDYNRASLITNAFNIPVDPAFKPRMLEAVRKTSSKTFITSTVKDLLNYAKGSPEYLSAYSYLSVMEREATEILLEMLSSETNKGARIPLLDLLKDIGKNQIKAIGEHLVMLLDRRLSDDKSYFISDIVNVLSETKSDQAAFFFQKAADHKNPKIRREVVRGLVSIGGKKAAGSLAKFLKDEDEAIQMMAIRGFIEIKGISAEDTNPLITFLHDRPLNNKEQPLTLEAIKALGKVGGPAAEELLDGYTQVRWWKSRELQTELKTAALRAVNEIKRRKVDGGPAKR